MEYIKEFVPDQLLIIDDYNDLPDEYLHFVKTFLKKNYDTTLEAWDWGNHIRIIHWEWKNDHDYQLIIDITWFPNHDEHGIIVSDKKIIFENDNQHLQSLVKSHPLLNRVESLEYVRKLKGTDEHMMHVLEIMDDLKSDLQEESVDEDEYKDLTDHYVHYSSDDASDISDSN
ncbi:MAG TPA: hypothetical protein VLG50_05740 [Candidatus Saccharimonadales bacterium]|nr:hypothetical protein [Candidatus Saccharimonadales bacterium]